jgi:hypothetical protein
MSYPDVPGGIRTSLEIIRGRREWFPHWLRSDATCRRTALADPVQIENDGPLPRSNPFSRHIDLISIAGARNSERPVQKTGVYSRQNGTGTTQ